MIKRLILCLFAAISITASSQEHNASIENNNAYLQQAVDAFAGKKYLRHATASISVRDIATGEILAQNHGDIAAVTASTMKTITSASAISILGKDFRFHTIVKAEGSIKNNKLHGNIVVHGYGDPTLGSRHFKNQPNIVDEVVSIIKAMDISKIEGKILFNESAYPFETFSDNWMVEDLAYDYGPGVHAINFSDNLFTLSFNRTGKVATDFRITPEIKNLEIISHVKVGNTQNMYRLLNIGPNPNIILYGDVKRNSKRYSDRFVNPNPAQLLCDSIENSLTAADVKVKNHDIDNEDLSDSYILLDHKSPALTEIVASLLDRSDNMFTEACLRAIAYNCGKLATTSNGVMEIAQHWSAKGVDMSPLFQKDGSGLARNNRATANFFTSFLRQVIADSTRMAVKFPDLMTKLGVNGNVGTRIKKSPLKGMIASKSGSMSDVQCYVGYFPADNPKYTWAVLINNWHGSRSALKDEIDVLLLNLFTSQHNNEDKSE